MSKFAQEETVNRAIRYVASQTHPEYANIVGIEESIKWFYYELLGWCGCGDPKEAFGAVRDYLSLVNYRDEHKTEENQNYTRKDYDDACAYCKEKFGSDSVYDNPLLLCLAYTMDDKELTEHGSSIGGAWLTGIGEMLLALLRTKEFEKWEG